MTQDNEPNAVDVFVGASVRMRRKARGYSQSDLGNAIGITFQQVQKYERGSNRISASKLYDIAEFLQVPVTDFFEGYGEISAENQPDLTAEAAVSGFLKSADGIELAATFPRIQGAERRRKILNLVKAMADEE